MPSRPQCFLGFVAATQLPWLPNLDADGQFDWSGNGETFPAARCAVEGWCAELQRMGRGEVEHDGLTQREVQIMGEGRLQAVESLSHGLVVGEAAKKMGSYFRMRHRKMCVARFIRACIACPPY